MNFTFERIHLIDTERYNTLMEMLNDPFSHGIIKELIINADTRDLITAFYVWDLCSRIYFDKDINTFLSIFKRSKDYKKLQEEINKITESSGPLMSEKNYIP